ncbi:MAG TPA: ATP-dependent Clp protease ATP-binding subunit [Candidatus Merdenecus merdavium]|nr:ATP-dependent Clp protease ATP-binding subunit [Candidatus Merdenecus merdavium]
MNKKVAFNDDAMKVIRRALVFATEMGHGFAGSEHILLSISEDQNRSSAKTLLHSGFDKELIKDLIDKYDEDAKNAPKNKIINLSAEAQQVIDLAYEQAEKLHHNIIEPEHLFLGILLEKNCAAAQLLLSAGADMNVMIKDLMDTMGTGWPSSMTDAPYPKEMKTETLDQFSKDLTAIALEGGFDPVIGRQKEIKRVVQILSRRTKNNPVLIGEPGVGKTAIAEGLAQRIVDGDVPKNLIDKRILSLDLSKMVSGTKYRGDFEQRIKSYIEEAQAAKNVIIFIDELHTIIGAGSSEGSMDAANTLKPALGRGEMQVIGATTLQEYKKHIEKDAALERRFQPVEVKEPSKEETVQILTGIKAKYEEFHELKITDDAIKAAVELSNRYIQDRYLPDKAIDLIDEAAASVKAESMTIPEHLKAMNDKIHQIQVEKQKVIQSQDFEEAARLRDEQKALRDQLNFQKEIWSGNRRGGIDAEDIATVVSSWTGVPVTMLTEDEGKRLMKLEDSLHKRVIGQDEAVHAVAKAIRRSRTGIRSPQKPIGTFLFLGPTGVGKTELSKALAEIMFQDENAVIRLDMSEYMEKHTVSKLIGSPPGYVGYDEGGQLTEKVRRKPYSIILFDEIEKAHPDVWNALLQIMDDGRLTDGQGRTVNFKNTIIIMTSNVGARDISGKKSLGFGTSLDESTQTMETEDMKDRIMEELKNTFQPEFLNRLDDTIVFHSLEKKHIHDITVKMLDDLIARSKDLGFKLKVDDKAIDILSDKGFDPVYGARPLQRVLQTTLEDAIAERMLESHLGEGDTLLVTGKDGEVKVKVRAKAKPKTTTETVVADQEESASTTV